MAASARTHFPVKSDTSATARVMPAEGPSLGTAPAKVGEGEGPGRCGTQAAAAGNGEDALQNRCTHSVGLPRPLPRCMQHLLAWTNSLQKHAPPQQLPTNHATQSSCPSAFSQPHSPAGRWMCTSQRREGQEASAGRPSAAACARTQDSAMRALSSSTSPSWPAGQTCEWQLVD